MSCFHRLAGAGGHRLRLLATSVMMILGLG
jgi:hypothetical protein